MVPKAIHPFPTIIKWNHLYKNYVSKRKTEMENSTP